MKTTHDFMSMAMLSIGYVCNMHYWRSEIISSPFIRIYYVEQGRAWIHLPNRDMELKAGYMYQVPAFVSHSYECESDFKLYYLYAYGNYQDDSVHFDAREFPIEVKADDTVELLFSKYCTLYSQLCVPSSGVEALACHMFSPEYSRLKPYEKMQLHGLTMILSSYFMKDVRSHSVQNDMRIIRVMEYVKKNVGQEMNLSHLTDVACVTKSQLIRLFRGSLGVSPLQYVIRCKIQHAQELLFTTGLSVNDISHEVGIKDVSYFIRVFKRHTGFTPQNYREVFR